MKRILTILTAVAVAASMSSMAVAQDAGPKHGPGPGKDGKGPRPGGRMRMMDNKMLEKLNLTAAQKKQLEALNKQMMEKMKTLREGKPEDRREKVKALQDWHRAEMKKILTAEQFAKFEKMMKEAREKFEKGERPNGRQGKPGKPGKPGAGAGAPSGKP